MEKVENVPKVFLVLFIYYSFEMVSSFFSKVVWLLIYLSSFLLFFLQMYVRTPLLFAGLVLKNVIYWRYTTIIQI